MILLSFVLVFAVQLANAQEKPARPEFNESMYSPALKGFMKQYDEVDEKLERMPANDPKRKFYESSRQTLQDMIEMRAKSEVQGYEASQPK